MLVNKKFLYGMAAVTALYFATSSNALAVTSSGVGAGTPGQGSQQASDVFSPLYKTLVAWTDGPLGKFIALLAIIIGIAAGIMRQSLTAVVIGLGAAIIFANAPTIIDAIMGYADSSVELSQFSFWK